MERGSKIKPDYLNIYKYNYNKNKVLSDIHLEYYDNYPFNYHKPKSPILVLGGDICYYKHKHLFLFLKKACVLNM